VLPADTVAESLALATGDAPSKVTELRTLFDALEASMVEVLLTTIFRRDPLTQVKVPVAE